MDWKNRGGGGAEGSPVHFWSLEPNKWKWQPCIITCVLGTEAPAESRLNPPNPVKDFRSWAESRLSRGSRKVPLETIVTETRAWHFCSPLRQEKPAITPLSSFVITSATRFLPLVVHLSGKRRFLLSAHDGGGPDASLIDSTFRRTWVKRLFLLFIWLVPVGAAWSIKIRWAATSISCGAVQMLAAGFVCRPRVWDFPGLFVFFHMFELLA